MAIQISTFIGNHPGALASFCRTLKEHGINMRAMNVSDATEFGIVRVITDNSAKARAVLEEQGLICQEEDVLAFEVEDRPGALVGLLETLGEAGVNLNYTYALFSGHEGTAGFVIKTENREEAVKALAAAGIRQLADDEL
ncbi:MAG: acetolactate synthase [Lachnospiraceae bacterium]|nr:acetolactate synthase [Lachnospiraceae bacterium]